MEFQPREKLCKQILLTIMGLIFIGCNITIACLDGTTSNQQDKSRSLKFKSWTFVVINSFNLGFLVMTMLLLPYTAYKKHRAAWNEYKFK